MRSLLAVLLLLSATSSSATNVVLIVADDLGYGELGRQRGTDIPTPHLDSLARNGVRCTSAYVTASYCSPSRAGLLTGRYQTRFGHELNPVGKHNLDPQAGLPASEQTLADRLKQAGYKTGLVGKWHLGGSEKSHPLKRGFDEFYGFLHEGHYYVPPPYRGVTSFLRKKNLPAEFGGRQFDGDIIWSSHMRHDEPPYDDDNPILRGTQPVEEKEYFTDALTRESLAFIEKHRQEPFFLYLAYNAVHSPMQGAAKYMERFRHIEDVHRRVFAAMLANLDDSVGAVLAKLRACGLEEDTLVIFLSDNGGPTAELTSRNDPLRGGKGSLYEGGVRVPLLAQWKGRIPAGRVYPHPVSSLDIFATASAAAGASPAPKDRMMDGVDLAPHLAGHTLQPPHEVLYWRMGAKSALRKGDWKIVRESGRRDGKPKVELYNLAEDLGEKNDLSQHRPEKLQELESTWKAMDAQMVAPVWTPRPR